MNHTSARMLLGSAAAIALLGEGTAAAANPTYYNDQAAFTAAHPLRLTDDYSNPAYVFIQNDATMSAVLGETDYRTTGFLNHNIVQGSDTYCAGCNGSFELSFQTTTIGAAEGIHGVGLRIFTHAQTLPFFAFITFADGTTANIPLPVAGNFWGVSAPERIQKIHFGLTMGGTTTSQSSSFAIDDLMIGDLCSDDLDCDDGDMCNGAETCEAGACVPAAPLDCGDGNVCTDDTCDPGTGCVNTNNVAPCEDADMCTLNTVCADGVCGGGEALDCDDDDVCTENTCDPGSGCGNAPIDGCCKSDGDCPPDQICNVDGNTCEAAMSTDSTTTTTGEPDTTTGEPDTTTDGVDTTTGGDTTTGDIPGTTTSTTTSGEPGTTSDDSESGGQPVTTTNPDTPTTGGGGNESSGTTGGGTDSDTDSDTGGVIDDGGCGCRQTGGDHLLGFLGLGLGLLGRRRRR